MKIAKFCELHFTIVFLIVVAKQHIVDTIYNKEASIERVNVSTLDLIVFNCGINVSTADLIISIADSMFQPRI